MLNKILFKKYIKLNIIKVLQNTSKCEKKLNKTKSTKFIYTLYKKKNKQLKINWNLIENIKKYQTNTQIIKKWKNNYNDKYLNYLTKIENNKKKIKLLNFLKIFKLTNKKIIKKNYNVFHNNNKKKKLLYTIHPKHNHTKYQKIFNNTFFELFKKKVNIINFNYFFKTKVKKFNFIIKKVLTKNFFLKKTTYTYKIIKIFLASLIYKDSSLVIIIIKNMFENIHYSKHKIYFNFWSFLIKSFVSNNFKKLNIFGLKIEFHGKLGVGGNSKKRSYYYHIGRCSNSSKIFKIDASHSYFKTATGVVGFTYHIYY